MNLSTTIYNYLSSIYDDNFAQQYSDFISKESSQYLRVNLLKTSVSKLKDKLKNNYNIETEEVKNFSNALKVLSDSKEIGKLVEHIIGEYYMQGLSSMIPPVILNPTEDDVVLDLCSAPGSKTTGMGELMNNKGTLIANEIALDRVKMLVYNVERMNLVNTGIIHSKGEWLGKLYNEHFDKILVDAPCSGLGILQKKDEVNNWWNTDKAIGLGELQAKLLISAIKMCKPEGEIVYSTCTLSVEENELVVDKILKKYPVQLIDIELPIKSNPGFTEYKREKLNPELSKCRRIFPWEADSDGFFIAKFIKTDNTEPLEPLVLQRPDFKLYNYTHKDIKPKLKNIPERFGFDEDILSEYLYFLKGNDIFFVNKEWQEERTAPFERIGTKFGIYDKNAETTFHTQAAQVLQKYITKSIYEIQDSSELKTYLEGGIIKKELIPGQCVIKYKDFILGSAIVVKGGIKSRFPRAKRTQGITYY